MISDLFATFDMAQLPNAVNEPTLARLTRFIHEDLRKPDVQPIRYTVRELVNELCKFNTSGTLCWLLTTTTLEYPAQQDAPHGTSGLAVANGGSDTTTDVAMRKMAATQRVFAHCARPVVAQVEAVLASKSGRANF